MNSTEIIGIITLISTLLTPIILSISICLKNIKRSKCCSSEIEMNVPKTPSSQNLDKKDYFTA